MFLLFSFKFSLIWTQTGKKKWWLSFCHCTVIANWDHSPFLQSLHLQPHLLNVQSVYYFSLSRVSVGKSNHLIHSCSKETEIFHCLQDQVQLSCQSIQSPSRRVFCFPIAADCWLLPRPTLCSPCRHCFSGECTCCSLRLKWTPHPLACLAWPYSFLKTPLKGLSAALLSAFVTCPTLIFPEFFFHPSLKPLSSVLKEYC